MTPLTSLCGRTALRFPSLSSVTPSFSYPPRRHVPAHRVARYLVSRFRFSLTPPQRLQPPQSRAARVSDDDDDQRHSADAARATPRTFDDDGDGDAPANPEPRAPSTTTMGGRASHQCDPNPRAPPMTMAGHDNDGYCDSGFPSPPPHLLAVCTLTTATGALHRVYPQRWDSNGAPY